jgi:hypothetical protein
MMKRSAMTLSASSLCFFVLALGAGACAGEAVQSPEVDSEAASAPKIIISNAGDPCGTTRTVQRVCASGLFCVNGVCTPPPPPIVVGPTGTCGFIGIQQFVCEPGFECIIPSEDVVGSCVPIPPPPPTESGVGGLCGTQNFVCHSDATCVNDVCVCNTTAGGPGAPGADCTFDGDCEPCLRCTQSGSAEDPPTFSCQP